MKNKIYQGIQPEKKDWTENVFDFLEKYNDLGLGLPLVLFGLVYDIPLIFLIGFILTVKFYLNNYPRNG